MIKSKKVKDFLEALFNAKVIIIVVALFVLFTLLNPRFVSVNNLITLMRQAAVMIIMAVGMNFIMISGGWDISLSAVAALSGIVATVLMSAGVPVLAAMLLTLSIGVVFGIANSFLVCKLELPALIATLATSNLARGAGLLVTKGQVIYNLPEEFMMLGRGYIGIFPTQVVIMLVILALGWFTLAKTKFGRYCFAIGGNKVVAHLSGIKVFRYQVMYFIIGSVCACLGGMIMTSRMASGNPTLMEGYDMNIFAACVLGGAGTKGGKGSMIGAALGALMLTIIDVGLNMNSINSYWQMVIIAVILLITIIMNKLTEK